MESKRKKEHIAFGKMLVVARLQMGVNAGRDVRQYEIAKKLGCSTNFLSRMEKGYKHPSVEMLAKIIRTYPGCMAQKLRAALGLSS